LSSNGQLVIDVSFAKIDDKEIFFTLGLKDHARIRLNVNLSYKDLNLERHALSSSPRSGYFDLKIPVQK
jgi:hypothetical protein